MRGETGTFSRLAVQYFISPEFLRLRVRTQHVYRLVIERFLTEHGHRRGAQTKQLAEFDDRADEMRRSLATLKRSYVIKLFADHADTPSLFGSLAKDLERLIG